MSIGTLVGCAGVDAAWARRGLATSRYSLQARRVLLRLEPQHDDGLTRGSIEARACKPGLTTRRVFSTLPMGWMSRGAASRRGFVTLSRAVEARVSG